MSSAAPTLRDWTDDSTAKSENVLYTTSNGAPYPHSYESQRAGSNGPLLLQDFHLIDLLSHFDRERIPERVVHAKGSGAHGIYRTTASLEDVCQADLFKAGKSCPITIRFSTVGGEKGSHDLARDPRGFAVKFKTEEGNLDIVGNNTPVFFLRDPAKFPHFIHTQKRDPATNLGGGDDSTNFWDYLSQNPESVHQVMILFSDRGIPDGYRHMNGYSGHALKLVNADGSWVYAQFHFKTRQGIKNIPPEKAGSLSADYSQMDLYQAIERGDFPAWDVYVQLMTPTEAEEVWKTKGINVLDLTHVWPQKDFPLRKVGEFSLTENAKNYFAEVEQAAFSPSNLVPGVEPTADPVLQSRLFSYPDTHRHRLGVNHQQLPVNAPKVPYRFANFQRDGFMNFYNQGGRPNFLSARSPIQFKNRAYSQDAVHGYFVGNAVNYLSEIRENDFNAPRALYERVFGEGARQRLAQNLAGHMANCSDKDIIRQQISIFTAVSADLGAKLEQLTGLKAIPGGIGALKFNGSHNGMASSPEARVANGQSPALLSGPNPGAPTAGTHEGVNYGAGTVKSA